MQSARNRGRGWSRCEAGHGDGLVKTMPIVVKTMRIEERNMECAVSYPRPKIQLLLVPLAHHGRAGYNMDPKNPKIATQKIHKKNRKKKNENKCKKVLVARKFFQGLGSKFICWRKFGKILTFSGEIFSSRIFTVFEVMIRFWEHPKSKIMQFLLAQTTIKDKFFQTKGSPRKNRATCGTFSSENFPANTKKSA